jgi:hypothetical protein
VVDAACCVGEDGRVAAQEACHTDGEDDFLHGVALVVVEAALKEGRKRVANAATELVTKLSNRHDP